MKRTASFDSDVELASDDLERELLRQPDLDLDLALLPPGPRQSTSTTAGTSHAAPDDDAYQVTGFGEGGLYMRNKRKKLLIQNDQRRTEDLEAGAPPPPQFFAGLVVYINGFTEEMGLKQLSETLIKHGGVYCPYLDRKSLVTHIIATNLTPSKRKEFASYKVALPTWLTDSATAGKLLPWHRYSIFAAPVLDRHSAVAVGEEGSGKATQQSLFGMGLGGGGGGKAPPPPPAPPRPKPIDETMESLSERGIRLAQLALAASKPAPIASSSSHDFFAPRTGPSRLPSSPTKGKSTAIPPTTTDSPDKPSAAYASYLPSKGPSERTTALLKDPEWLSKNTSASENFLQGYFQQSRLHQISTWKEELKALVADLQPADQRKPRTKPLTGLASDNRTVFHIDFDCFFVAAGLTTRPELKGKPVAVCHGGQGEGVASTSEIATCSYEARAKGVKSGISLGRAREMCPDIITIPFEFDLYRKIASQFYSIVLSHADFLQAVSIDEVLMELSVLPTSPSGSIDPALDFAESLRDEIRSATGCEVSVGVSHNILLARLASRRAKPAGSYHLLESEVESFLKDLPVGSLPGIGYATESKLEEKLDVTTVGDLLRVPKAQLVEAIGKQNGDKFEKFARGIDPRELEGAKPRQTVGAEINYGIRFETNVEVERFVRALGVEVATRLSSAGGLRARHLTLKVMKRHPTAPVDPPKFLGHGHCDTHSLSTSVQSPSAENDGVIFGAAAWKLLSSLDFPPCELRGIGISLTKLEGGKIPVVREKGQGTLSFAAPPPAVVAPAASRPLFRPTSPSSDHDAPTSTSEAGSPPPPPNQAAATTRASSSRALKKDISIVVLTDSDSDSEPAPRPPPPKKAPPPSKPKPSPPKKTSAAPAAPKLAPLFRSSKALASKSAGRKSTSTTSDADPKVSDNELVALGIDPEYFRAIPTADQVALLATKLPPKKSVARSKTPAVVADLTKQSRLGNKSTKPTAGPASKAPPPPPPARSPTPVPAAPAVVVSSSPTDSQLQALGITNPVDFRAYPLDIQREVISDKKSRLVKSTKSSTARDGRQQRAQNARDVVVVPLPVLMRRATTLEEVRDLLEGWVESTVGAPVDKDVMVVERFVEKALDRSSGQDMEMVGGILGWMELLVEDRCGKEGSGSAEAIAWWQAWYHPDVVVILFILLVALSHQGRILDPAGCCDAWRALNGVALFATHHPRHQPVIPRSAHPEPTPGSPMISLNQLPQPPAQLLAHVVAGAGPGVVDLGTPGTYAVFAGTTISNTPNSVIGGDVGLSPGAANQITGLGLSLDDAMSAFLTASAMASPDFVDLGDGEIGGLTLAPGLYSWSTGVTASSAVKISGLPTDSWVFQVGTTLEVAKGVQITSGLGALSTNIFWQVGSAATLQAGSHIVGTVSAKKQISILGGATVKGRIVTPAGITLTKATVSPPLLGLRFARE
ncbi:hypothetical protein RQP46_008516 [Phenoliferia psychrophenolica]